MEMIHVSPVVCTKLAAMTTDHSSIAPFFMEGNGFVSTLRGGAASLTVRWLSNSEIGAHDLIREYHVISTNNNGFILNQTSRSLKRFILHCYATGSLRVQRHVFGR